MKYNHEITKWKITHCGGKRVENNGRLRLTLYYSSSSEDNSN